MRTTVLLHDLEGVRVVCRVVRKRGRHQFEVFFAVSGCRVHEAGARVGRHVIAGQERNLEFVPLIVQRMSANKSRRVDVAQASHHDLCMHRDLLREIIAQQQATADMRERSLAFFDHLIEAV